MFYIDQHDRFSQYVVKRRGAGVLPAELSGIYTSPKVAQDDITRYTKKLEEDLMEAAKREQAKEDADKKPLSDAQRKKRNAKKTSTPRK